MIKFNILIEYKGTNDVPAKLEFYIIDYSYNYRGVLEALGGIMSNFSSVVLRIEIKPGEKVVPF